MKNEMAPGTVILDRFLNVEDGLAGEVARIDRGFSAVLRDLDADEVVPGSCRVFTTYEQAVECAKAYADQVVDGPISVTVQG